MTLFRDCFQHLSGIERRRIPPTPAEDLRLHRLERPDPWPAEVMEAIWAAQSPINFYPDYSAFLDRLADHVGRPREQIVVGAGIEDFIRTLVLLCCDPGDTVAFTWPTCAMFDIYANVFGAKAAHIVTHPDEKFGTEELLSQIPEGTKLVILPNPGQPVETFIEPRRLRFVATCCRAIGAVLAIDEAYHGFGATTSLPLIDDFENVVVLRTFSKAFGGAGLRVGYAIGSPAVIKPLDAIRQSGEIAGPSLHAATVLMDRWETDVSDAISATCEGRDWLRDTLRRDGYRVRGQYANHVLIELQDASRVAARLKDSGVHVKADFPAPVDRHILVTCGSIEMMRQFYAAFNEAV